MGTKRLALAAALVVALAFAAPAAARDHDPVRFWSVSKVSQGGGAVPVGSGAQVGGKLQEHVGLGPVIFNLPLHAPYWDFLPRDRAFGSVFSNETGKQYSVLATAPSRGRIRIGEAKGGIAHLDEYQAYEKRAGDASLRITLSDLLLQTVDDNNQFAPWACPPGGPCDPVRTVVRFHARAYAASAGGDFFDAGGVAYLKGHQQSWRPGAATSADASRKLWGRDDFGVDGDADDSRTGAAGVMFLNHGINVHVPLDAIRPGELFAVHVTLEAEAVDEAGGESAAQAFIQDPQKREPLLLTTHGLAPKGKPRFKEPRAKAVRPARCRRTVRHAGQIQLGAPRFTANESDSSAMVLVTRAHGSHGPASVQVATSKRGRTTVRFAAGESGSRLVEIPLREDAQAEPAQTFAVKLGHARCGTLGHRHRATVTIVDDDVEPPANTEPAQAFTLGGTVDGLQGSGLVLTNFGTDVAVPANGRFTFPGTRPAGTTYDVQVRVQPQGQLCTVANGRGTVSANVTTVAVRCATPALPLGLDATFGTDGRVSTPVGGGHGEAVVIQPGGGIVTAGWAGTDFKLTRHDSTGTLDKTFGTDGIATADSGGDDEAFDAALLPGNGIVAVGRSDQDFGVARFDERGAPAGSFVKTDLLGGGDQANAVAVQGDGKIVVAGYATRNGIDGDFALVRYNADGTPDEDFGTHGEVTTDLGTPSDDARALVIRPDGTIVVAGTAGEDVALARYTDTGGVIGSTISDFGSEDVATGVALTPGGDIVVGGYTLGPGINRDFLLARYSAAGVLDPAGTVVTDVLGGDDYAENLLVDGSGRIVVVGRASSSTILDMALVRFKADGTLDPTFADHGILTADFHGRGEFGQDVALDASGRIVAAGYTANGSDTEFALMRAKP